MRCQPAGMLTRDDCMRTRIGPDSGVRWMQKRRFFATALYAIYAHLSVIYQQPHAHTLHGSLTCRLYPPNGAVQTLPQPDGRIMCFPVVHAPRTPASARTQLQQQRQQQ